MFEFLDFEGEQLLFPHKNTNSKFCPKNSQMKGILKRPNHIVNNPTEQICRKIDFDNDQETITVFPEADIIIPPKNLLHIPDLCELVNDFKKRGFMSFNITDNTKCSGSKFAIKSAAVFQSQNSNHRTPLNTLNNSFNTFNQEVQKNPVKNFDFGDQDFPVSPNLRQNKENSVKIKFTNKNKAQQTPTDKNSFFQNDITENDTYINNILKQTSLIDFNDLDDETQNNFFPTKPKSSAFRHDNKESQSNSSPHFLFDDDTTNKSIVVLPKKKKASKQEEIQNSIDTLYITQAISKQPIQPLFNNDETTTTISFKPNNDSIHHHDEISDEDNEITKADIDEQFESEHSVILPISNESLGKKHSFLNTSKDEFAIDSIQNEIDSIDIEHIMYGISKRHFLDLQSDISSKYENLNRLYSQISRHSQHALQILGEHPEEGRQLITFYALKGAEEILGRVRDCQENMSLFVIQARKYMKMLENAIHEAKEELERPKSSWDDFQATIQRLENMQKSKQTKNDDSAYYANKYRMLKSIIPFKVNSIHHNQIDNGKPIVKYSDGKNQNTSQMDNAIKLHVLVAKNQRARKKKEEMISLMSLVPGFFFDGKIFSCLISSDKPEENKLFRFALFIKIPSFYPWCYLSIDDNSIRSDFGLPKEEIKARIDQILKEQKLSPHPLTDLIQAIHAEFL